MYGNEEVLGQALFSSSEKAVSRDSLFITTKIWCTQLDQIGKAAVEGIQRLFGKLGSGAYFDQILIHWPFVFERDPHSASPLNSLRDSQGHAVLNTRVSLAEAWKQMEELQLKGLARSIGVSNFTITHLQEILKNARIKPAVNQVEMHPYMRQEKLRKFCLDQGIHVVAYSPLGSGGRVPVLEDPIIKEVAAESGQTPAQVCLAWAVGHGCTVIPKTSSTERLVENASFKSLTLAQMSRIDSIRQDGIRGCNPINFFGVSCFD